MRKFNFFSELKKEFGSVFYKDNSQLVMIGFESLYIEGVKNILLIESECIRMIINKNIIEIKGEKLETKELSGGTVLISGKIDGVNKIEL